MEKQIKIGIIGMSPGNAHPYSWPAIINGHFNGREIAELGYPAVADYLEANRDTLGLPAARVTHVWTQDRGISESIAANTQIPHVAQRLEDLVGQVDAVLLSRDDAENHVAMARVFIEAGVPIFIDKPLATTREDLAWFAREQAKGRLIMSCSSMRYANECRTAKTNLRELGNLLLVTAVGKKDWNKYGVHLLEALFSLVDDFHPVSVRHVGSEDKHVVYLEFRGGLRATLHLFQDIVSTFQLSLYGQRGWRLVDIRNSYSMFRDNIIEFIRSVQEGRSRVPFEQTEGIIRTLIGARESLREGGRTVLLQAGG